jgi:hypothetical protein
MAMRSRAPKGVPSSRMDRALEALDDATGGPSRSKAEAVGKVAGVSFMAAAMGFSAKEIAELLAGEGDE